MGQLRESGFSLIEVLVSILVLAIGVIGAAGMQLTAMRTNQQAAFHTQALQLAAEMADAVRAGEEMMAHANPYLELDYRSGDGYLEAPDTLCYTHACDAEEFAAFEIYEWKKRIRAFPGGRIVICRDAAPWSDTDGELSWECDSGPARNAPIVVKLGWQAKNPDGSLMRRDDRSFAPSLAFTVGTAAK